MTSNQTMDYMFDLNTSIHIVGHVLIVVCVEDFPNWWHLLYATSLIVPVFMRFQLSWLDSSICQIFLATMEILICYIFSHYGYHGPMYIFIMEILIYVYCTWLWPHMWHQVSCLFMAIVLLCIRTAICTCSYMQSSIIVLCWLGGWSSIWDPSSLHFWDGLIMYFGHCMTPLTSHIRGHLL